MHRRNYRTDVRAGDLSVCVVGGTTSVIVVDCLHGALRRESRSSGIGRLEGRDSNPRPFEQESAAL